MRACTACAALHVMLSMSGAVLGCSGRFGEDKGRASGSARVAVRGSDTMVILAQKFAERFQREHPEVSVEVSGGGTGTGIAALDNGTADLATASRAITGDERARIEAHRGAKLRASVVALDAIAIYVHRDNPIRELTLDELSRIYRGERTRWSELDPSAPARTIVLYGRENSSGTYAYFKEHVLGKLDFAAETQSLPGTAAVIYAVRNDRFGIGYGGIAYASGLRVVPIRGAGGEPTMPTRANAESGRYPLARPLFVYDLAVEGSATVAVRDFMRSDEGQSLVEAAGFFPAPRSAP